MRESARILIVDDDVKLLRLLAIRLQRAGWLTETAESGRQALAAVPRFRPHAVVTDVRMSGMDGLALFDAIHNQHPTLPVIILTAHGTIPDAVDAAQRGVFAYLTKPFDSEQLTATINKALRASGSSAVESRDDDAWRSEIVTRSPLMESLLGSARKVAQTDSSILIQGESGTGKELLARAVHRASRRASQPFVAVNCTAIPEALFESEFFGHRKGAFTGASDSRVGLIQSAHGGSLLLDEIGDMPLAFQAKLLRALQEREVRPVGASEAVSVDVRVIASSHQDLELAVSERRFREDLYYRVNVVTLEIPALAARREDIPLLAAHFLNSVRAKLSDTAVAVTGFSAEAVELLVSAPWPGNIRQLRNVVEQCVVLANTPLLPATLVQAALRSKPREFLPFAQARDHFEFEYLVNLLQMTQGNVAQAARLAERNRSEFYKLLRKHELNPQAFRDA
ncbi:MAG TPA: sigma 54-interacting transcriptional regulator [Steroidobacteraceae bacterium]|nr:sigma 54-interacting transcriptional regulator [Steroidobacteraceae bacterium]